MPSKKLREAGVSKATFDKCVADVKKAGSAREPFAVCEASLQRAAGVRPKKKR